MVLNSLNFCLSEKLFISPSILNEILARYSNLGCRFFPFSTLNISCHSLLACRVSAERSAVKRMGFPLYVTCCFSLAVFNILSLCLVFVIFISKCLGVFLLGLSCMGFFVPLGLERLFPFPCWGNFQLQSLQKFFHTLSFSLLMGLPIIRMLVCLILSQRSLRLSCSFHSFYFSLLFRSYFHHFTFQLADSFFCFRYSAIDSF